MLTMLMVFILLLLISAVLVIAVWLIVEPPVPFDETVRMPLPAAVGGTIAVEVNGTLHLKLLERRLQANSTLRIDRSALNESLPTERYSILDSEVSSEHVASLLGRVGLVADSPVWALADDQVILNALIEGEFLVRERTAQPDAEQPGAGTRIDIGGEISTRLVRPQLTPTWQLQLAGASATIALDAATVRSLRDRFGNGDEFVVLLEDLLNSRLAAQLDRFVQDGQVLRPLLQERIDAEIARHADEDWAPYLRQIAIASVEVDRCPRIEEESISLGMKAIALWDYDSDSLPTVPDLQLVEGNCPAAPPLPSVQ